MGTDKKYQSGFTTVRTVTGNFKKRERKKTGICSKRKRTGTDKKECTLCETDFSKI